ncbi:MAG: LCCL domain-containing protein [Bacteroidota bacterium]
MRTILLIAATFSLASSAEAQDAWAATATSLRGEGGTATYTCPPGGTARTIWGTDLYTDDSSVCTAAVHSGLITLASGGEVTIWLSEGADSFSASARHGIESNSYGPWSHGFRFPGKSEATSKAQPVAWDATMRAHRGQDGLRIRLTCPAGGTAHTVWGAGPYTDDSSVCTAAVHAGVISLEHGGTFTAIVAPGRSEYAGSTRHGIESQSYGEWGGSVSIER